MNEKVRISYTITVPSGTDYSRILDAIVMAVPEVLGCLEAYGVHPEESEEKLEQTALVAPAREED